MTPDLNPSRPFPSELLTDLYYPSESDEPIAYVDYSIEAPAPLTSDQLHQYLGIDPETRVEEMPEADFWQPLISEEDWYGDEERARTAQSRKVQEAIHQCLTNRQVFRVGETEVDVYLLGQQPNGHWAGLKTNVVET
jgi:hypothetical protein